MLNNINEGFRLGGTMNDKNYYATKSKRNSGFNIINNSNLPF